MLIWPTTADELIRFQDNLRHRISPSWRPGELPLVVGGCFVCFGSGPSSAGARGDPGWAGAALLRDREVIATTVVRGTAGAPYQPGLLALREGPLLTAAVRALPDPPDVLLVNATGRDHPRRAGLALHLGALLDVPTIGVTNRPLLARGERPASERGSSSSLRLEEEVVGAWLRTRFGAHPLVVHAAWRTDPPTAIKVVLATIFRARTPEPLRQARCAARTARARDQGNAETSSQPAVR